MRKYWIILVAAVLFISCNQEDAFDCVKTTGDIISFDIALPSFNDLDIYNNIDVTIEQGAEQQVTLITGKNLKDKIDFNVNEGVLTIQDMNTCSWARDYGKVQVHIITNNLTQIRSSGGGQIRSEGELTFEDLTLISEQRTADFILQVDMNSLKIINNNLSNYFISGAVSQLFVHFFAGDGRFEGKNLIADDVDVYHEGTNDIIINPQRTLSGELQQTGNVIYCKEPPIMTIKVVDDRGALIQGC